MVSRFTIPEQLQRHRRVLPPIQRGEGFKTQHVGVVYAPKHFRCIPIRGKVCAHVFTRRPFARPSNRMSDRLLICLVVSPIVCPLAAYQGVVGGIWVQRPQVHACIFPMRPQRKSPGIPFGVKEEFFVLTRGRLYIFEAGCWQSLRPLFDLWFF